MLWLANVHNGLLTAELRCWILLLLFMLLAQL